MRENVDGVKEKILSKLKEIGKQASSKNATLDEIKRKMICLQMAQHSLIHSQFRHVVTGTMRKVMIEQKKRHGVLTLSELFTDTKLNSIEKYWCEIIVNSIPIFSGAAIHSFNTKHVANLVIK